MKLNFTGTKDIFKMEKRVLGNILMGYYVLAICGDSLTIGLAHIGKYVAINIVDKEVCL